MRSNLPDSLMLRVRPALRQRITVQVTPAELHKLVTRLEDDARRAIEADEVDLADHLLARVAELREAAM